MSMIADERQRFILEHLNVHGAVKISEIAEALGVSEMTVHRDLNTLAKRSLVQKVHGGAVARNYTEIAYVDRAVQNHDAKVAIAKRARDLVRESMRVYLSPGSTAYELALVLDARGVQIYTNSLPTATALARADRKDVTLLGGRVVGFTEALVGPDTEAVLQNLFFHYAFIAVTGVDLEGGLTVYTEEEVRVLHAVMRAARKTILITDASKYGLIAGPAIGPLDRVHGIITDSLPEAYRAYCEAHDIEVTLAQQEEPHERRQHEQGQHEQGQHEQGQHEQGQHEEYDMSGYGVSGGGINRERA